MSDDLERLVVQLEASITKFEKELRKAPGTADKVAKSVEQRFSQMNRKLDGLTSGFGRNLTASLGAIGSALAVTEVAKYADAWTKAKNALAVSGVTGSAQVTVLDALFASAQKNATPINALADLYGKAAQAQTELGATSGTLIKFTDGVATALRVAGTSSTEASGALLQLSQLLGSGTVHAEEFNSVNEGARPILIAVANGLTAAGGSVSKLKTLVNEGAVSSRAFFEAFLKGLPVIEAMASNAVPTLAQGYTKVENALTKYIGTQDQSLGATAVLSKALNYLADHFNDTADIVLKVAGVIAAVLVGRAIGGMVASLGLGTIALARFISALRTVTAAGGVAALATSFGGLTAAAGPVGAIIGVIAAAGYYLHLENIRVSQSAERAADAIEQIGDKASSSAEDVRKLAEAMENLSRSELLADRQDTQNLIARQKDQIDELAANAPGARNDLGPDSGYAASGLSAELAKANEKLFNGGSLKDYNRALDELSKKYPEQAAELAKAQKAAELYTKALDRRAQQDDALAKKDAQGDGSTVSSPRRMGAASQGEQERADARRTSTEEFFNSNPQYTRGDANKTDTERAIDKRVDEITAAMEKAGKAIDKAAVRLEAEAYVRADEAKKEADKQFKESANGKAFDLITDREGFISESKPDYTIRNGQRVNSGYAVGYGFHSVNGRQVQPGDTITREDADAELKRRISQYEAQISEALGPETFGKLSTDQKAALDSIVHNYGKLPTDIANAVKNGTTDDVARAIRGHADDNGGINRERRNKEASVYEGAATPQQKQADTAADFDKNTNRDSKRAVEDLDAETAAINRKADAIARGALEQSYFDAAAEKSKIVNEELRKLDDEHIEKTPERIKQINEEADAQVAAAQRKFDAEKGLQDVRRNSEGLKDAENFFAEGATSAFTDVITGASKASDAIRKLASSFLEAGIQALLMGKGPLAGIFGTASSGGGTGGLFGALFSGFKFAKGGEVHAASGGHIKGPGTGTSDSIPAMLSDGEHVIKASQAKKHRRLLDAINSGRIDHFAKGGPVGSALASMSGARLVPAPNGQRIGRIPRGGDHLSISTTIDLSGANGDETIKRIAKDEAQRGVAAGLKAYDRNFNNRVQYSNTHER